MTFDELVDDATAQGVTLRVNAGTAPVVEDDPTAVLLQVPLLALAMLIVLRSQKVLSTANLATWTLAVCAQQYSKLRAPQLRWSLSLRRQCAEAIEFLELAGLVAVVEATPTRRVKIQLEGSEFLSKALRRLDEMGSLTRQLVRACRRVELVGEFR